MFVAAIQECIGYKRRNKKYLRHHMPEFRDILCVALETSERRDRRIRFVAWWRQWGPLDENRIWLVSKTGGPNGGCVNCTSLLIDPFSNML
jgi:hypothetical protein